MPNSPQTTLASGIAAADTSMTLEDASVLPAAPNICTIGNDENAEVVSYTTITGNVVSGLVRGVSGTTASVWVEGTIVARDFTSYDHDTFIGNINDLESRKIESVSWGDIDGTLSNQTDLQDALDAKADTADLGTLATQDSVDYDTEVDNKPILGTLASKDDVSNNDTYYLRRNGVWTDAETNFYNESETDALLDLKAPLASPALTGAPTAPTPDSSTNSTRIATTAFVQTIAAGKADVSHNHDDRYYTETELDTMLAAKAPLASPALTGTPTAPTPTVTSDSTLIATTEFVQNHAPINVSLTVSAGTTATKSDDRITATMRVINLQVSVPINAETDISWTTAAGSVTFTGKFAASFVINCDLIEVN